MSKTIFITGASSGIGKATAEYFAKKGWQVIGASRHPEDAGNLAILPNVKFVKLDISDLEQVSAVVGKVIRNSQVDVLYNNAGTMVGGPLEFTSDELLSHEFNTNLLGPIRVTQAFIPHFRERGSGLIINTTSLNAIIPGPFMALYTATKGGLERWGFAMNLELNAFGIRVKTIIPGIVKTNLYKSAVWVDGGPYAEQMNKVMSALGNPDALSLASEPVDIAKVVFEAATDGSDQIRYLADGFARENVSRMVGIGEEQIQKIANAALFN